MRADVFSSSDFDVLRLPACTGVDGRVSGMECEPDLQPALPLRGLEIRSVEFQRGGGVLRSPTQKPSCKNLHPNKEAPR